MGFFCIEKSCNNVIHFNQKKRKIKNFDFFDQVDKQIMDRTGDQKSLHKPFIQLSLKNYNDANMVQ